MAAVSSARTAVRHPYDAPTLALRGLGRSFAGRFIFRHVSLELSRQDRLAVTGENGAGKSTLIRLIAGALEPSEGAVLVDGQAVSKAQARRAVGASLAQERSFYLRLSGRDNLEFFARVRGLPRPAAKRAARDIADELDLAFLDRRVDRCSTGMVQQLAFARALLGAPRLLVLDEPTRSLDDSAVDRFWAAIARRPDTAVVLATHRPEDVERCGRGLALGAPDG